MRLGMKSWTKRNGLPSMPNSDISDLCQYLWSEHSKQVTCHITKFSIYQFQTTFEGAIFHCEDKQSSSLRIYCSCLHYQSIEQTIQDPSIFEQLPDDPSSIISSLIDTLQRQDNKSYPWIIGPGRQLPSGCILAKRKKHFRSGRSIISFVESPFRPIEEGRSCEAWFQLTFRPQKWNLKAHMWYQLSPFTGSNMAIAIQHDPGNIQHQDNFFSSYLAAATLSP